MLTAIAEGEIKDAPVKLTKAALFHCSEGKMLVALEPGAVAVLVTVMMTVTIWLVDAVMGGPAPGAIRLSWAVRLAELKMLSTLAEKIRVVVVTAPLLASTPWAVIVKKIVPAEVGE